MQDLQWSVKLFIACLHLPCLCVGLTCLQCTDLSNPRDCGRVRKCGSHEVCYVEQIATQSGFIRYNTGCKDSQFCKSSGRRSVQALKKSFEIDEARNNSLFDLRQRSAGDLEVCESCCDTDLCNAGGCGATGYPARQNRGPVCYTCVQQSRPELCDKIKICGTNSVCKVKLASNPTTGDIFYTSDCENPQICRQEVVFQNVIVGRKRMTEEVQTATGKCLEKCCDGDLCNGYCGSGNVTGGTSGSASVTRRPSGLANATGGPSGSGKLTSGPTVSGSPKSTTSAPRGFGCVYKYRIYSQGETWQDGCDFNCTCENAATGLYRCDALCPTYTNLPPGCILQKPAGECCSKPVCHSLTNSTHGGCYVQNKIYLEGERWVHDCKSACKCLNGTTGQYQCDPICLTWKLPAICHLVPPARGKCCHTPSCPPSVIINYPPGYVEHSCPGPCQAT